MQTECETEKKRRNKKISSRSELLIHEKSKVLLTAINLCFNPMCTNIEHWTTICVFAVSHLLLYYILWIVSFNIACVKRRVRSAEWMDCGYLMPICNVVHVSLMKLLKHKYIHSQIGPYQPSDPFNALTTIWWNVNHMLELFIIFFIHSL